MTKRKIQILNIAQRVGRGILTVIGAAILIGLMLISGFGGIFSWGSPGSQNQTELEKWFGVVKENQVFMQQKSALSGLFNFLQKPGPSTFNGFKISCSNLQNVTEHVPADPPVKAVALTWKKMESDVQRLSHSCSDLLAAEVAGQDISWPISQLISDAKSLQQDARKFAVSVNKATSASGLQKAQGYLQLLGL